MPPADKKDLIESLKRSGYLRTPRIIRAFMGTNREGFLPREQKPYAYIDQPLPIGAGQTISAPHMVAIMTELLDPRSSDKVLEVGGGSGYQAAILSGLVRRIYSIELDPNLATFAEMNLMRAGIRNVAVIHGDGSRGYPEKKPYDKIIVTCATPEIFGAWTEQLKEGGLLLAPVGGGFQQELVRIRKTGRGLRKENHGGCVFVPLRRQRGFTVRT
jgi:protein-L-isoaspartate(D-aspartate) O-methyltransferase